MTESEIVKQFEKTVNDAAKKYSIMYGCVEYDDIRSHCFYMLIKYVRKNEYDIKKIKNYIYRWAYWYCYRIVKETDRENEQEYTIPITYDKNNVDDLKLLNHYRYVLNEIDNNVLELFLQGYNCTDIAKKLKISKQNVHHRYKRIVRKIRKELGLQ